MNLFPCFRNRKVYGRDQNLTGPVRNVYTNTTVQTIAVSCWKFSNLIYYLTIFQHCIPLKTNEVVDHTGSFYTNNIE